MPRPKKAKSPAYQWYPRDWAIDEIVSTLDNEGYGVFRRFYDSAWLNDGLPSDVTELFKLSRVPDRDRFEQLWMAIQPLFPEGPGGRRRNPQQELHRREQRKRSQTNTLAARRRWNKAHTERNANAVRSHPPRMTVAVRTECFAFAFASADQDQEQRGVRRAPPARMVLPPARRRHLLAAAHKLLDSGAPYVDEAGTPQIAELSAQLKLHARRHLHVLWQREDQIARIIDAALGRRAQLAKRAGGGRR